MYTQVVYTHTIDKWLLFLEVFSDITVSFGVDIVESTLNWTLNVQSGCKGDMIQELCTSHWGLLMATTSSSHVHAVLLTITNHHECDLFMRKELRQRSTSKLSPVCRSETQTSSLEMKMSIRSATGHLLLIMSMTNPVWEWHQPPLNSRMNS